MIIIDRQQKIADAAELEKAEKLFLG